MYLLVCGAGFAALSWEVLWQLKASISLGISALGTALILATTMGGMTLGAVGAGRFLKNRKVSRPARLYAGLEVVIGASGLLLAPGFAALESLDSRLYLANPSLTPALHCLGIAVLLGLPTMAMGATIPLFGIMGRAYGTSLSRLYGLNTLGAAAGCLGLVGLIPALGVSHCILTIAGLNFTVAAVAASLPAPETGETSSEEKSAHSQTLSSARAGAVAFATGFAIFSLEVAWFRSLRAAFHSTTDSFAIMLAAVLLALAAGARLAPLVRARKWPFELFLCLGGVGILLATPLVERFDLLPWVGYFYPRVLRWFGISLVVLGIPVALVGVVLPYLLDEQQTPRDWGRVYGLNTLGAILGALLTAWLLLPWVGATRTCWLVGLGLALLGAALSPPRRALGAALLGVLATVVSVTFESGVGTSRVQGRTSFPPPYKVLSCKEGPEATICVIEVANGDRVLFIDGFETAGQMGGMSHYMEWMGRLPMVLHENPKKALVICFGTGQTANGIRRESIEKLDIVDLNQAVFGMAELFPANESVLQDPVVSTFTMDGRAWMRRTDRNYDIITLEPMSPNFAGVNALYCEEFYRLARARLNPDGIIAQWVPYHIVPPYHATSVAATFQKVFPNCVLWVDPVSFTGILVGRVGDKPLGEDWPGLEERPRWRSLEDEEVIRGLVLDAEGVRRYAGHGDIITDDNQLLAYKAGQLRSRLGGTEEKNLAIVHWASQDPPPQPFSSAAIRSLKATPKIRR